MRVAWGSRRVRGSVWSVLASACVMGACSSSLVDVEGTCIAVVNIDGVFMTTQDGVLPPDSVAAAYTTITRHTGCIDNGEVSDPLGPGESNFLEVGTTLYRVPGFGATERLAYRIYTGEWLTLTGIEGYADLTLAVGEYVTLPVSVLNVGVSAVVSDSRCPAAVDCLWAGDAVVEVALTLGSGPTTPHRLHVNSAVGPTSVTFGGYDVRLVSLAPEPQAGSAIPTEDYRARLLLVKKPTG